nr:MAG TPA: hypothetical protein [Caudoviricetes sp.]
MPTTRTTRTTTLIINEISTTTLTTKKLHKTTFYSLSNSKNYNHYEKLLL